MNSMNYILDRFGIEEASMLLNLQLPPYIQDWELELARVDLLDPLRLLICQESFDDRVLRALFALYLASIDESIGTSQHSGLGAHESCVIFLLRNHFDVLEDIVQYWCVDGARTIDDQYAISPWLRDVRDRVIDDKC